MTLVRHSRLQVWRKPRNDRWNNTCVFLLHKRGLSCVKASTRVCERLWIQILLILRRWRLVLSYQRVLVAARLVTTSQRVDCAMRCAAHVARPDISRKCPDNVRNLRGRRVRPAAMHKGAAKVVKTTVTTELATALDNLDTEDLTTRIAATSAVVVENAVT